MSVQLKPQLELSRCPHCNVDNPSLPRQWACTTKTHDGRNSRFWAVYQCARCGGLITASGDKDGYTVKECYPGRKELDDAIPSTARAYLSQAIQSLHAPAGAVMLAASAVDAMLKAKGYKKGSMYERVNKAAEDHLITEDMSTWAHQVRLDANDQRHADEDALLPNESDARRCIHFAEALATFVFVLPSMVTRGLKESSKKQENTNN